MIKIQSKNIISHLRFYKTSEFQNIIEIETFVNSINFHTKKDGEVQEIPKDSILDIDKILGTEVVINIGTDIKNKNTFYTDSNGLEL